MGWLQGGSKSTCPRKATQNHPRYHPDPTSVPQITLANQKVSHPCGLNPFGTWVYEFIGYSPLELEGHDVT